MARQANSVVRYTGTPSGRVLFHVKSATSPGTRYLILPGGGEASASMPCPYCSCHAFQQSLRPGAAGGGGRPGAAGGGGRVKGFCKHTIAVLIANPLDLCIKETRPDEVLGELFAPWGEGAGSAGSHAAGSHVSTYRAAR